MTNVEYFEMIENEGYGCTLEEKNSKYMRSIARSLAVMADGLNPREEANESYLKGLCSTCKYCHLLGSEEPCNSCFASGERSPKWEPKEGKE